MVYFYSASGKTAAYAEVLAELLRTDKYELQTELRGSGLGFNIKAAWYSIRKKESPVTNMPSDLPDELYLCSPVWAASAAPPVRYFLNHAPLSGKKVNILLTAAMPDELYRKNALDSLTGSGCVPGEVYLFATGKNWDKEIVREHLADALKI